MEEEEEISTGDIRLKLVKCGYTASDMVEGPGQFSLRGGILDIYPCNLDSPVRIEFWGDEIDSISFFDIVSQRRTERTDKISLSPVSEIIFDDTKKAADKLAALSKSVRTKNADKVRQFLKKDEDLLRSEISPGCADKYLPIAYERLESPLDYFPDSLLIACETSGIKESATYNEKLMNEEIKGLFTDGELCKGLDDYYFSFSDILNFYKNRKTVYIDNFARGSFDTPVKDLINYHIIRFQPGTVPTASLLKILRFL